jgi:hypothetical protein
MGFMNKSDAKNHLSARELNGKRLYRPVCPSDASGFLGQKLRAPAISISPQQTNASEAKVAPLKSGASKKSHPSPTVHKSALA